MWATVYDEASDQHINILEAAGSVFLVIYVVEALIAVGETVFLLHPLLPLVGVSIWMERERQQNDSLANG